MNDSLRILDLDEDVSLVNVSLAPGESQHYTYKTTIPDLRVDDLVLVEVAKGHGLSVCRVELTDVKPDHPGPFAYKWIAGRVTCMEDLRDIQRHETAIIAAERASVQESDL
jgi:hypothetical protein